jgi:starch synthase
MTYVTNLTVDVAWRKQYCGIFKAEANGVTYYFLDNEYYFGRSGLYSFYDDCERFTFFSRAVLEMLHYVDFKPDVIHSNDWQTALIPVYYQVFYKYKQGYEKIRNIFTIHNIQYQGKYGTEVVNELIGLPLYHSDLLMYDGCVNLMKGAIQTADKITTVSPSYAWEILDPWYSHGLDRILVNKQYKLCGFLNGIDTIGYDPSSDSVIAENFSASDLKGKKACKEALLRELGLQEGDEPVVAIITRLVSHKGLDLVKCVFEDILALGCKFVVLGTGEEDYENFFIEMQRKYPDTVSANITFDQPLARKIYSGADVFLMPSQSEPCGLAQMICMRYGTVPIVRETGGLRDTVVDCGGEDGNGFTFKSYNAHDMLASCRRAVELYRDTDAWNALVKHDMQQDFSWDKASQDYIKLYDEIVSWNG